MKQAAIPDNISRLAGNYRDCAPGHRFLLYCPVWDQNFNRPDDAKRHALEQVATALPRHSRELQDALVERQQRLFQTHAHGLRIEARSTAPFATGLGNEHPVENGFAFLSPYGLPYLAGSGVKGVLRRAAEEMALYPGEYPAEHRPTLLDVWWLFGFEPPTDDSWKDPAWSSALEALESRADLDNFIGQGLARLTMADRARYTGSDDHRACFLRNLQASTDLAQQMHRRGALSIWDVFPEANHLLVEIMTPHYGDYYFNEQPPHDAGQPTPVPFLAVPDGVNFTFHITCQPEFLPEPLQQNWIPIMKAVLAHAFDWLGFGAKTAVGYGVLADRQYMDDTAQDRLQPIRTQRLVWEQANLEYTPNNQELVARQDNLNAIARGKEAVMATFDDPAELESIKKRQKKRKPNIRKVEVEAKGNQYILHRVFKAET